jgi:molybdenum cofactor cytidylyltransferase
LAAGRSSRLGQPKQMLPYKQSTLIENSIAVAKGFSTNCFLVLGSNFELIKNSIDSQQLKTINHQNWNQGIGSSISFGLKSLLIDQPNIESVMLMLCDQPFVNSELLSQLQRAHLNEGKSIAACSYNNSYGVPAIFSKIYFEALLGLSGDIGAKKIISNNIDKVQFIEFQKGSIDIDTTNDLDFLK